MKTLIRFSVFAFALIASNVGFAAGPFGLGVVIGDPTGFTGKYWLSSGKAIDGALGWSDSHVHLHINHIWHRFGVFDIDAKPIDLYYGIGARLRDWEKDEGPGRRDSSELHFGARAPVGLRHQFRDPAIEVFIELALSVDLVPDSGVDLDFGLGGRYFF